MKVLSLYLAFYLALSPAGERTFLWLGKARPPQVKGVSFLRGEVKEMSCELKEAEEVFKKAKSHFDFMEVEEAVKGFKKAKEMLARFKYCDGARRLRALSELYLGMCRLAVGKEQSARMYFKYAIQWGAFKELPEGVPPFVKDEISHIKKSIKWCRVDFQHPLTGVSFLVDGTQVHSGEQVPCGRHLVSAYLGKYPAGSTEVDVDEEELIKVPLEVSEENLKGLIQEGLIDGGFVVRENGGDSLSLKFYSKETTRTLTTSLADLGEKVWEILFPEEEKTSEKKEVYVQRSAPEVNRNEIQARENEVSAKRAREIEGEVKKGAKEEFFTLEKEEEVPIYKNPYFWGGIGSAVAIGLGIFIGVKYGGKREKKDLIEITW